MKQTESWNRNYPVKTTTDIKFDSITFEIVKIAIDTKKKLTQKLSKGSKTKTDTTQILTQNFSKRSKVKRGAKFDLKLFVTVKKQMETDKNFDSKMSEGLK